MVNKMIKVKGRLIMETVISNVSPLLIGSETEGEWGHVEVLKDNLGMVFIPGSTLAGVFRYLFAIYGEEGHFFGSKDSQSVFVFSDAVCLNSEPCLTIRDGVCINIHTGRAEDKKKFDYELVEPGEKFRFEINVRLNKDNDKSINKKQEKEQEDRLIEGFQMCAAFLETGLARFGRMTAKGFGQMRLVSAQWVKLDYLQKEHVVSWLSGDYQHLMQGLSFKDKVEELTSKIAKKKFSLDICLGIVNSLIVRRYLGATEAADSENISYIKDNNGSKQWVLPGTSVKGALRHRAIKIINTISGKSGALDYGERFVEKLMGSSEKNQTRRKSRLVMEESVVENVEEALQTRIKIDRFTGGIIEGALFNSTPLWPVKKDKNDSMVHIQMAGYDISNSEKGLLMLLLKDLWSGDLALGGEKSIGRGILQGIKATVYDNGSQLIISKNGNEETDKLEFSGTLKIEKLEQYVQALHREIKKEEELMAE